MFLGSFWAFLGVKSVSSVSFVPLFDGETVRKSDYYLEYYIISMYLVGY